MLKHGPTGGTVLERLAFWIDATGDCWEWAGHIHRNGYGQTTIDGIPVPAHRAVWEELVGPIEDTLDHLCRNRPCCNPDHLEDVSSRENWSRGENPFAKNARKTHCKHGHSFDEKNTHFYWRNGTLCRRCRKCTARRSAATRRKKATASYSGQSLA